AGARRNRPRRDGPRVLERNQRGDLASPEARGLHLCRAGSRGLSPGLAQRNAAAAETLLSASRIRNIIPHICVSSFRQGLDSGRSHAAFALNSHGGTMSHRNFAALTGFLFAGLGSAGCAMGPSVSGSFDRTLSVSGPIRLELTNTSGDVSITGSADGKVHVHADAHASGMGFESPEKRLNDLLANPPVEQRGSTIHVGEEMRHLRNVSISYVIEVPHDTEVASRLLSGAQTIQDVRGPVKAEAASGSIRVNHIERQTQLSTLSGSIRADNIGHDIRANSASGTVTVSNIKGDVRISALSGSTQITKPGGRVDASTASGSV